MRNKPLPVFTRRFRQEPPPDDKKRALIECYKKGGLRSYELVYMLQMDRVSLKQAVITDPLVGDDLQWIYVGELWWCRKRKPKRGDKRGRTSYEFARLVALRKKEDNTFEVEGLWDCRRHEHKPEPVIVYKKVDPECKGYIVGRNEYEVLVAWEDRETLRRGVPVPVRSFEELVFEFTNDHDQYEAIFSKLRKLC
jgi:hypothetical protein